MQFAPKVYYLSNGIPVILDAMDTGLVYVSVNFNSGGYDEKPTEYGITHFCEHMFGKETERFPTKVARTEFLENNGGRVNGVTSPTYMAVYGDILAKNTDKLIDVLADELNNALFNQATIDNERKVIINELHRAMDNSERQMSEFTRTSLLGISVPDGRVTLGNEQILKSFTREQLVQHARKMMSAKNSFICISGKIYDQDALLKKLDNLFAKWSNHHVEHKQYKYNSVSYAHHSGNTRNVSINICLPGLYDDTYKNIYQNTVISTFENYLNKELMKVLRYNNGLVYGIDYDEISYGGCNIKIFETQTEPENIGKVTALMAQTMANVYNTCPVTNDDLNRFRTQTERLNELILESGETRCNTLSAYWSNYDVLYDFNKELEMVKNITTEDVIKYTRGYFENPISILTHGADYKDNLLQIWNDNFKIQTSENHMLNGLLNQNRGK